MDWPIAPPRPEWNQGGGDHDKQYVWNDGPGFRVRFSRAEQRRLSYLRESVLEVQHGQCYGPAWDDVAPDGGEWKFAEPE